MYFIKGWELFEKSLQETELLHFSNILIWFFNKQVFKSEMPGPALVSQQPHAVPQAGDSGWEEAKW